MAGYLTADYSINNPDRLQACTAAVTQDASPETDCQTGGGAAAPLRRSTLILLPNLSTVILHFQLTGAPFQVE